MQGRNAGSLQETVLKVWFNLGWLGAGGGTRGMCAGYECQGDENCAERGRCAEMMKGVARLRRIPVAPKQRSLINGNTGTRRVTPGKDAWSGGIRQSWQWSTCNNRSPRRWSSAG